MAKANTKSVHRGIRVPLSHDAYLQQKAIDNPGNKHNNISTEINLLIESDFKKAEAKKAKPSKK